MRLSPRNNLAPSVQIQGWWLAAIVDPRKSQYWPCRREYEGRYVTLGVAVEGLGLTARKKKDSARLTDFLVGVLW